jgi:O-succinylbenzoic acid--CoA ligase
MEPQAYSEMKIHSSFSYNGFSMEEQEWRTFIDSRMIDAPQWEQVVFTFIRNWIGEDDVIEVQTSGSTGQPQTSKVNKKSMVSSATLTANYFNCKAGSSALLCLPGNFIAGKMMLVRAMTFGWSLRAIRPTSNPLSDIEDSFDFAAFTPMQLSSLSDQQLENLAGFGVVIIGGAALSESTRKRLLQHCDNLYETYGMAETLSHVALRKLTSEQLPFHALEGVSLSVDMEGRLQIHAPYVQSEVIQTNDIVELIDEKSFWYKGRFDRMINSGGVKLFAEVIERKLEKVLSLPYTIGSVHDDILGQKVILYLEGASDINLESLGEELKKSLNRFEVPKEIRVVEKLERTESGKIKVIK